ncbi:Alpha-aminoadipate--LysW ligase LysX [Pirellulimonas nuda]|uniref:Alpha-aminoadipate--LysW ligase LysX n=1 Tax=Pirellulimonas nuda TaxID=2528009 RepID=A0A518DGK2_9BACT|nr:RimK family alpha-L-glutamate ligase [Pirellulimonas nuda]QDU90610.1 Alpha-aminoadipate--LysW ligase LysX [Pirellulimonas nuda]
MRLVVLGSPNSWYFADLQRAAAGRHTLTAAPFSTLTSGVVDGRRRVASGGCCLNDVDGVLVRTMPPGSLEQVVFRMDALGQLEQEGIAVLNTPRAIECAVDKYLATCRLAAAGLDTPETYACQTADQAMEAFDRLGRDAVLKPVFGGEGRGVTRLTDADLACRAFSMLQQLGGVIYLQRFVPHRGEDLRLLVLGERVLGMRRRNPADWRTNISRGATAGPLEVTPELAQLARRAAACVGASLAGVDLLPGVDGRLYALEVNAVPGWRALVQVTGVDVAREVLALLEQMARR